MSIEHLKSRLRDVPGIQNLTMQSLVGRNIYGWSGLIAAVDPNASDAEIETAIRNAAAMTESTPLPAVNLTERKPMTTTPAPGSFAASIRAMMDEARAGVAQARTDGLAKVSGAIGQMNDAKVAIAKVSSSMAQTIENEAAEVLSELGQISNDL